MVFNLVLFILPWAITWRLGRAFGWIAYNLLTKRKSTLAGNIRRAYPNLVDAEQAVTRCDDEKSSRRPGVCREHPSATYH